MGVLIIWDFFTLLKLFKFRYLWFNRSFSPQNNLFPSKVNIPIFNKNWIFDFNESNKIIYTSEICHVISDILREISSCLLTRLDWMFLSFHFECLHWFRSIWQNLSWVKIKKKFQEEMEAIILAHGGAGDIPDSRVGPKVKNSNFKFLESFYP